MISNEWTYDCNNLCNACMMSHERNTGIARRSSCMVNFSTIIDWLLVKNMNAKQEIAGSSVSLEAKRREHKAAAHTGHRHTVCLPQTKSTHRAELDPHNSWHIIARALEDEAQTVIFCVAYRLPITWESAAPIFKLERGEPDGRPPTPHHVQRPALPCQSRSPTPRQTRSPWRFPGFSILLKPA